MLGEPREAGVKPRDSAGLGAVEEAPTEPTAQEITAPFRLRLRLRGRSVGASLVRKNSQTRPRAAGDRSSKPPLSISASGAAVKVRAGASVGTQAEGVRRGLRMGSSRLFGSPQRRMPGERARCCALSPYFKPAPGQTAPVAARPAASARLDGPALPGRDLLRALSEQLAREGSPQKTAPATGSVRHI